MSRANIKEITKEEFDKAMLEDSVSREINWFASVVYTDCTTKYFVFDEPYAVTIADFFDMTNKDNTVLAISLV